MGVGEDLMGEWEVEGHEEGGPVDAVKALEDQLASR